ncbi:MAG TPA: glutamate-1-semialdehyde 2,1-aminomutase [Gemmatimonadaceae bacterium]|nr:glutamate-1-semialdehyde 2,1-aminomutase [Gemmatimonadaceae bacterium]
MKQPTTTMPRSHELRSRAHALIPGGAHTYSKGDDQFPEIAPGFLVRGKKAHVWDPDGNEYVDWGMGLRAVILGHADPGVIKAVTTELSNGSNFIRPSPIEVEVAELLAEHIPSAEMVKFAKNGSDVTTAAVRLSRAFTGRDLIVRCADHPFYSVHDWFIGDTIVSAGIPDAIRNLTKRFRYNSVESLEAVFAEHPNQIAAVILEAVTVEEPRPGFLQGVRDLCSREGAILIFDEIITGFRFDARGAQNYFGVTPDLSTWSKAIGNGLSVSALCGRKDVMERGGLRHQHDRVFLLSNTFGGETHHLAALREVATRVFAGGVIERIWEVGRQLKSGFTDAAAAAGLGEHAKITGYDCSPIQSFTDANGAPSPALRTLFLQEMVRRGVLIPYIAPSAAHTDEDIRITIDAAGESFEILTKALESGTTDGLLIGEPTKPVFRQRN